MKIITESIACDPQPINGATLVGENRFLTSFVTPDSLEIQEKYKQLTAGISGQRDKIIAVWEFVKNIPYTPFIKSKVILDGRVFSQGDTWLDPGQALRAGIRLNCMNKSILLASLLRQELSPEEVYVCLCNVNVDGIDGHAVGYIKLDDDYIIETTNPGITTPFLRAEDMDIYEAVLWVNDKGVRYVEGASIREPLGYCCIKWLEEYVNEKLCQSYV